MLASLNVKFKDVINYKKLLLIFFLINVLEVPKKEKCF